MVVLWARLDCAHDRLRLESQLVIGLTAGLTHQPVKERKIKLVDVESVRGRLCISVLVHLPDSHLVWKYSMKG
jgi:hypothetical protein